MAPGRRYKGFVARNLLNEHTYHSVPTEMKQRFELTKVEASILAEKMKQAQIPIKFEHKDHLSDLGKVVDAWVDKDDFIAEFELDEHASAQLIQGELDSFRLNCLSLTHVPAGLVPIEMSVCEKGARPGTVIVDRPGLAEALANMKISASELNSKVYKTTWTEDSLIQASSSGGMYTSISTAGFPQNTGVGTNFQALEQSTMPPNGAHPFSSPDEEKVKREKQQQALKQQQMEQKVDQMEQLMRMLTGNALPNVGPVPNQQSMHQQMVSQMPPQHQIPNINQPSFQQQQQPISASYPPVQQQQFQQPLINPAYFQQQQQQQQPNYPQQQQQFQQQQQQQPNPVQFQQQHPPVNNNNNNNNPVQQQQQPQPVSDPMQVDSTNNNNSNSDADLKKKWIQTAEKLAAPGIPSEQTKQAALNSFTEMSGKQKQTQEELEKLKKLLEETQLEKNKAIDEKKKVTDTYHSILSQSSGTMDKETLENLKKSAESGNISEAAVQSVRASQEQVNLRNQLALREQQMAAMQQQYQQQMIQNQMMQNQNMENNQLNMLRNNLGITSGFSQNYSAPIQASNSLYTQTQPVNNYVDSDYVRASANIYARQQAGRGDFVSTDDTWKKAPEMSEALNRVLNQNPITGMDSTNLWKRSYVDNGVNALRTHDAQFDQHKYFDVSSFQK